MEYVGEKARVFRSETKLPWLRSLDTHRAKPIRLLLARLPLLALSKLSISR